MTARQFTFLAVITAVMLGAAVYAASQQKAPRTLAKSTEIALPKLAGALNDAAEIVIKDGQGVFTLRKNGARWVFVERDGYEVPFQKIKTALVGLSDLKLLEKKTADPVRHERLHLDEPKDKNSKSKLVTIKTADGDVLASVYVGRRHFDLYGKRGGGTYIRPAGQDQTWLAEGEVNISTVAYDWVDRKIVDLPADVIARAVIAGDGDQVIVSKATRKDEDFALENLPKGREIKSKYDINSIGRVLSKLELEDVKKVDDADFAKDAQTATFTTFDGLTVRAEVVYKDLEYWARFMASAENATASAKDAAADAEGAAPKPDVDAKADAAAKPDGDDAAKADAKAAPKTAAERAAEINQRVAGWAYKLPSTKGEQLTRKLKDVLKDPEAS